MADRRLQRLRYCQIGRLELSIRMPSTRNLRPMTPVRFPWSLRPCRCGCSPDFAGPSCRGRRQPSVEPSSSSDREVGGPGIDSCRHQFTALADEPEMDISPLQLDLALGVEISRPSATLNPTSSHPLLAPVNVYDALTTRGSQGTWRQVIGVAGIQPLLLRIVSRTETGPSTDVHERVMPHPVAAGTFLCTDQHIAHTSA